MISMQAMNPDQEDNQEDKFGSNSGRVYYKKQAKPHMQKIGDFEREYLQICHSYNLHPTNNKLTGIKDLLLEEIEHLNRLLTFKVIPYEFSTPHEIAHYREIYQTHFYNLQINTYLKLISLHLDAQDPFAVRSLFNTILTIIKTPSQPPLTPDIKQSLYTYYQLYKQNYPEHQNQDRMSLSFIMNSESSQQ